MRIFPPYWARIVAKVVLSRMPFGYSLWQRLGMFRHGAMDESGYALQVFDRHVTASGLTGQLEGLTILELGPGDSLATALIASAFGARAVLVDTGRWVGEDLGSYRALAHALSQRGLSPPDLTDSVSVDDLVQRCRAEYHTQGLRDLRLLRDQSVDFVFSQAVLEHVREREFVETMQECHRVLKPGALASHRVDLKDHLGGGLNNLRFSDDLWEKEWFAASSGFYTNRIRYGQMIDIFRGAGFAVVKVTTERFAGATTPCAAMAPRFRDLPSDDLLISGFDVLLRAQAKSNGD
jgi:SAM-dependent methyltransferase